MMTMSVARFTVPFAAGILAIALGACSTLRPTATPNPAFFALESAPPAAAATGSTNIGSTKLRAAASSAAPTLIINPARAAAGFDSQRIIYVREPHKLEYFAHSEWVDPPARMLAPLLVAAIERSAAFRAVVLTPSAAVGELRLDTEIIRLQHEFGSPPSRVRFTLRAYLVEDKTRRVLAWREFEAAVAAASENPYGGVVAANRAVQSVLEQLAAFCAEAARGWKREQ